MHIIDTLTSIRDRSGTRKTLGLTDEQLSPFLADPDLARAVGAASAAHAELEASGLAALPETELITKVQEGFVNFYDEEAINPYVALAAAGPWLVTAHGAVLHDSGGYGMLGSGHAPSEVLDTMREPWVMANIMTPSVSQLRFTEALRREVGHTRGGCPFDRFLVMNSGSEAVTVGMRISDINAKDHHPRKVKFLVQKGAFHGRTDRPAQASSSSLPRYRQHLHSFAERDNLIEVPPDDVAALEAAFAKADADGVFIEMMLIEPVMGEGNPGRAMSRAFYDAARRLTRAHGSMLLIDSIQAGLRATGDLSIVDYPGFEDAEPPDMETYSKALNAGQFPMSVLALNERAAAAFRRGVYGNTMTANPRSLEVATTVLAGVDDALRTNIRERGHELVRKLEELKAEFPEIVLSVQGTGLLVSAEIHPSIPVVGFGGLEEHCRVHGMGIIHGGKNALRFTPHFRITTAEIDLLMDVLRLSLEAFQIERAAVEQRVRATATP
ncbi:MAG: aminotransferase class III-fold pyridoxal phosphate-dependent enzyme [Alphaproteobacteria bacterium]|nr:aminotransferase class III-fold pyridoxal phosphate-dependent enzyme [Alphaproteobacteria bacterium]